MPNVFAQRQTLSVRTSELARRDGQELREDDPRVEKVLGDHARGPAVTLVVALDCGQRIGSLIDRAEAKHALAARQERARTRLLYHGRLSRGEVAERAVADPAVLEAHAGRL